MTSTGELGRRIPTFNAAVIMALPVAAVLIGALASRYVDGARPLYVVAFAGGWLVAAIYPGLAGYVAARSTTPTLTMFTSAAIAIVPVGLYLFRTRPFKGVKPPAPFELSIMGSLACLAIFVAVLLGIWVARTLVNRGHVATAFIAGAIVQFVVMAPGVLFLVLLPATT